MKIEIAGDVLRIGFFDPLRADYHVGTVLERPLAGTQSAGAYLAMELARLGHEVFYISRTSVHAMVRGVTCFRWKNTRDSLKSLKPDVLIVVQRPGLGPALRQRVPAHCRIIFWPADTPHQPVLRPYANPPEHQSYDKVVCVSHWQRQKFVEFFKLPESNFAVIGYGCTPFFQNLFTASDDILSQKEQPPTLAYTSTPHRGLEWLVAAFPLIHRARRDVRLKVFSGLTVYFVSPKDEANKWGNLYKACRNTPGIEYIGNVPQAELARQLRSVSILAYSNVYDETSCIAMMEAMAAGCGIVTTKLGALPETAAGFASLVPFDKPAEYLPKFAEAVVALLDKQANNSVGQEAHLRKQVDFVNREYNWTGRAQQWLSLFAELGANGA